MKKIFGYLILKVVDYPAWKFAEQLARRLSFNEIEELLAGKKHLQKYPRKREKVEVKDATS